MTRLRITFWLAVIGTCMIALAHAMNPYEELGVSSRSTAAQIKKAYRKLAREWHPDRNRAEGANEKFMRINEAYETLTDAEKRSEYDNFGRTAGQSKGGGGGGAGRGGGGFNEFFQQGSPFSGFGGFGGGFGGGEQRQNNAKDRVTMQQFRDDIEGASPGSSKPYLFFVTGTMCFMCMQLEPIWEQAATELKAASYGVGRVLGDVDQALARRLGVRQLPEIVAFVNGEAVSMKASRYNVRGIVDFASDALSTPPSSPSSPLPTFAEVIVLESSSAFDWFVSGWRHDNLARTLFIGPRTTLRFTVPCFMLRKRHLCAFVHSSQPWIMDKGIYSHLASERVVVLLEDTKSPAASVTANRISVETIQQTMLDNQWLVVPRLSSQATLDELCPVTTSSGGEQKRDAKTFCVVLLTRRDDTRGRRSVDTFRKYARDYKQNRSYDDGEGGVTPKINFAYLYKSTQEAFFEALEKERQPPTSEKQEQQHSKKEADEVSNVENHQRDNDEENNSESEANVDPIAFLWRTSTEGLRFQWAPRGWASIPTPDSAPDSDEQFNPNVAAVRRERKKLIRQSQSSLSAFIAEILATPPSELHQHFIAASSIPRLWDEHQGNLLVRGWKVFYASLVSAAKFIKICLSYLLGSEDVWFSYLMLFMTLGMVYLASYVVSSFMEPDPETQPNKNKKEKSKRPPSSSSSSSAKNSAFWEKKKRETKHHNSAYGGTHPLNGTPIQLLTPDLYDQCVLEARGLGIRVLVLVVPHGLFDANVTPRQGWWAYPSVGAILKERRARSDFSAEKKVQATLASQFTKLTEPLLRQDRRLVLTVADQLLHADWLHDLIDPVLDGNGISIPELPPVGLCLALHGARRYFSLYWPPEDPSNADDGGAFLGMEDDSNTRKKLSLDMQTFNAWLERLMDGQLPRLHVENWPEDLAIEEGEDEVAENDD